MDPHTITEDEFNSWKGDHWVRFASSFGDGAAKTMDVSLDGVLRVKDHGRTLYVGVVLASAIAEYNSAP